VRRAWESTDGAGRLPHFSAKLHVAGLLAAPGAARKRRKLETAQSSPRRPCFAIRHRCADAKSGLRADGAVSGPVPSDTGMEVKARRSAFTHLWHLPMQSTASAARRQCGPAAKMLAMPGYYRVPYAGVTGDTFSTADEKVCLQFQRFRIWT